MKIIDAEVERALMDGGETYRDNEIGIRNGERYTAFNVFDCHASCLL
jgi:hypothetical protein